MTHSQEQRRDHGIDLCCEIQQLLNQVIRDHGHVGIDDQRIWAGWLDHRDNHDWQCIFELLADVDLQRHMTPSQSRQIMESVTYFAKHRHRDRAMDHNRRFKKPSWQAIMVIREVFNDIHGLWLNNRVPQ